MLHQTRFAITLLVAICLVSVINIPGLAQAGATITVVNLDGPGEGFNDPTPVPPVGGNTGTTLGEQRFNAFQRAADIWGSLLDSSVEIRVEANFDPLFCDATSATLGAAGPNTVHGNFTGAPVANTWYPGALANSLAGTDLAPANDDIGATFNSSIGTTCSFPIVWYYGLDGTPPAGTIDFVTVVLHELGHGLGFLTLVNLTTGAKFNGLDDTFMLNLEDHTTGGVYPNMTNNDRVSASINSGNLHWVGPNVIGESEGLTAGRHPSGHVEMYAPDTQQPGSSVSHFSTSLSPDELMEPFYTVAIHDVGLTEPLMQDIGWVTVNSINDAPVANDDSYSIDEDTTLTVALPGVLSNDTDIEGDPLTAVLVTDVASGILTLNSDGSFVYTPNANFIGTDIFTYQANDTLADSNVATVTITVGAINDAPAANDDSYSIDEDTTLSLASPGVLGNDTDTDGDPLTAVLITDVASGSLTLNTDGSFDYTTNANFTGTDSFTYQANDTLADSNVATVIIAVGAINDAPVANDDSYSIDEDTTLTVVLPGVLGNDADVDGDPLTAVLVTDVASGSLTLNTDGSFVYTPTANFSGTDSFTYTASDGNDGTDSATVTITVGAVNDAPVANDDFYSIDEDATLTVVLPGVLLNDTDVDGDPLTAVLVTDVASGSLTLYGNGSFVYRPTANFTGIDSFTYTASDGNGGTDSATVTITVGPDVDDDGILDQEEYGPDGNDNQYDGNNDSMPDSQQDNVASFYTYDRSSYVTLAVLSPVGTTLSDVRAVSLPGGAPSEMSFPYGFFSFTINGAPAPPAATILRLFLPDGATTIYYKYGQTAVSPTDHWYEFLYDGETGAEINGNVITLHFVDGGRGDDILLQDGMIIDQGGPGVTISEGSSSGGGGGGGGCFIATAASGSPSLARMALLVVVMSACAVVMFIRRPKGRMA